MCFSNGFTGSTHASRLLCCLVCLFNWWSCVCHVCLLMDLQFMPRVSHVPFYFVFMLELCV